MIKIDITLRNNDNTYNTKNTQESVPKDVDKEDLVVDPI